MTNSILDTIKKMLGLDPEYEAFDTDIIISINTTIMMLKQIGVGLDTFYGVTGRTETWNNFLGNQKDYEGAKTYIYLKTRLIFDPPANSFVTNAIESQLKEIEYRLYQQSEYVDPTTYCKPTYTHEIVVDSNGDATIEITK